MSPSPESGQLFVHWSGREDPGAPTLVLMHGLTDSGECWADAVPRWERSYRIAGMDALGHGRSPRFTAEQLARDPMQEMYDATVASICSLSDNGANPVVVVGHSMGGGIGAALAAWRPDLVRAVVLEDPAWFASVDWSAREAEAAARVAECQEFADDLDGTLARERGSHPQWPQSELLPWARAKADSDPGFLATGYAFLAAPWTQIAAAITVPTLVVTGTDDVIIGPAVRTMIESVGNAQIRVETVAGAGHSVRRDSPAGFHAIVDPFLTGNLS